MDTVGTMGARFCENNVYPGARRNNESRAFL